MSETNHQPGNTSEGIFVIGRCVIPLKKVYMEKVCYWLDMNIPLTPKMISKDTFMRGLAKTIEGPSQSCSVF